ncbi:DUF1097 domain-containing protein [Endozoicomonas ascidiicola]|uniref:DUF1097 domain-containing protein n=1 Tax=Endozoicomonas ascidiicola TaxID=1698521 RepID=UPI000833289A|nr:DUF1097 domain-containing protein [Endozoicomonas ascidiicola]
MPQLFCIALTTGLLSGLWAWIADSFHLLTWAGFLGCTSFFATQGDLRSLAGSIATNISGIVWAMVMIYASTIIESSIINYVVIAVVSFLMCIQAHKKWLAYIPGTFIGACSTFAANGDWKIVAISLLIGALIGYAMKHSGLWLHRFLKKESAVDKALSSIQ